MNVISSDIFTGIGLLMNIIGVYYLTLVDLFTSKPIRMWWFLVRHVDRENPQNTKRDPPVDKISPVGGGHAGLPVPNSSEDYDIKLQMMSNQAIAAIGLIFGFVFQFIGLLM